MNACSTRMNAKLLNWQHVYKIRPHAAALKAMAARAIMTSPDLRAVEAAGDKTQLNIIFAGPSQIRRLNDDTRGIGATTDVLSFPMLEFRRGRLIEPLQVYDFETRASGVRVLHLGDIVICPKRAEEQAASIGQSLDRELIYLTLHGALHLIGYDHIEAGDARLMRAMEKRLLAEEGSLHV